MIVNRFKKREWYKMGFDSVDLMNPFSKKRQLLAWSFFNAGVWDRCEGHEYYDEDIV